jgi:dihydropyrimidinase/dihydroorotase
MGTIDDLKVENARVVTESGIIRGGVSANDGVITNIGADTNLPDAERVIDAENKYLIPGFIDPHNHMGIRGGDLGGGEEGYLDWYESDMETETRAALHGGTTSLVCYIKADEYLPMMEEFVSIGEEQSYLDFGFHASVHTEDHLEELEELAEEWGVRSYGEVLYNMYSFRTDRSADSGFVYRLMKKSNEINNSKLLFHTEDDDLVQARIKELKQEGRDGLDAWADASPGISQAMRIEGAGMLTEFTGATSYVVHNSMKETIPALKRYQEKGVELYGETLAPFLGNHCEEDLATGGKISPPVGYPEDQDALWKGLRTGVLQHVGTDHCAFDLETRENDEIWDSGLADTTLETFLPIMLSEGVNKDRISMERMVEVCSTNNAKRFGIYPQKGVIAEGSDADMVIVDLDKSAVVDEDFLHGRDPRWSSQFGKELTGLPSHVIVGGELAVKDDERLVEKGDSEYLPQTF